MALGPAPEWLIARWFGAPAPINLRSLRGRVVLAVAFQMLCPGCVAHALPQASRAREAFAESDLAVVGLHTVFEHHAAQGTPEALAAFLHEYRLGFPVGLDAPDPEGGGLPLTMRAYRMEGTPTTLLVDRRGNLRMRAFGHLDDMRLGAAIAALIAEGAVPEAFAAAAKEGEGCDAGACRAGPEAPG